MLRLSRFRSLASGARIYQINVLVPICEEDRLAARDSKYGDRSPERRLGALSDRGNDRGCTKACFFLKSH